MKHVRDKIGIFIILVIILSVSVLGSSDIDTTGVVSSEYSPSVDSEEVTGVPYVWQEINGFCMWAAVSMAIQHAGVPLDLYDLFATFITAFIHLFIVFL